MIKDIIIADKVKDMGVFIAFVQVGRVSVKPSDERIRNLYEQVKEKIINSLDLQKLKDNPVIKAYRKFYWSIGIDPTKQRPSSEALIRRVLRGLDIPFINNVVDIGNIVSMETMIPIGIYDLDKIKGEILYLREANENEVFVPIGGKEENLKKGQIVLSDKEKILHVYPHRDSIFTKVSNETQKILIIACGVPNVNKELVYNAAYKVAQNVIKYVGGELISKVVIK